MNKFLLDVPNTSERLRIFCFPYAGGGASTYRNWNTYLKPGMKCYPIQLPGRENRISETPYREMDTLVKDVVSALVPYLDTNYILFGHSMGAKIACEVGGALEHYNNVQNPCHLIVSGSQAPHIPDPNPLHNLPEDKFIEGLKQYSGMSQEFLENKELMKLFMPLFRADFVLDETYTFKKRNFSFPISALYGSQDVGSEPETDESWSEYTHKTYDKKIFQGDHFFIKSQEREVVQYICQKLEAYL